MKTILTNLRFFLTVFLGCLLASIIGITLINYRTSNSYYQTIGSIIGAVITFWMILVSFTGLIYLIVGLIRLIYVQIKKVKQPLAGKPKSLIIKGFSLIIVAFIVFFAISLALSFFSIGSDSLRVPNIPS